MTQVLVTGAAGYLGSRLCAALSQHDEYSVRALVRRPVEYLGSCEQVVYDLVHSSASLAELAVNVDVVVHLAGANEIVSLSEPERALTETITGTYRIAHAAAASGVKRLVYVSTVHVYGPDDVGSVFTESTLPSPRASYGIARLASEHVAAMSGIDVVVLRLTNSVGAPSDPSVDRWTLLGNDLCRQAATVGRLRLRSDGGQWRDFIAIEDACRGIEMMVGMDSVDAGVYNLGSGEMLMVRRFAEMVQDVTEVTTGRRPPLMAPDLVGEAALPGRVATERFAKLGFRPRVSIRSAIEETLVFCMKHRHSL